MKKYYVLYSTYIIQKNNLTKDTEMTIKQDIEEIEATNFEKAFLIGLRNETDLRKKYQKENTRIITTIMDITRCKI